VPTLADRGCRVVSATDPHGRNLGFLDPTKLITRVYFNYQKNKQNKVYQLSSSSNDSNNSDKKK
jgi:hypothetical protein